MTNREKELRNKISEECLSKNLRNDYHTAKSNNYDFIKCPEEFECLKEYMPEFLAICDDLSIEEPYCEECWKKFLRK